MSMRNAAALFCIVFSANALAQTYKSVEDYAKTISHSDSPVVISASNNSSLFGVAEWSVPIPSSEGEATSTKHMSVFVLRKINDAVLEELERSSEFQYDWPYRWQLDGVEVDGSSGFSIYVFHQSPLGRDRYRFAYRDGSWKLSGADCESLELIEANGDEAVGDTRIEVSTNYLTGGS